MGSRVFLRGPYLDVMSRTSEVSQSVGDEFVGKLTSQLENC
jgi:hypothetical protein